MFSDFDNQGSSTEGRGRRTVSLLLAGGIFAGLAVAIAAAVATAAVAVASRLNAKPR